jgi:hypothetical protein
MKDKEEPFWQEKQVNNRTNEKEVIGCRLVLHLTKVPMWVLGI